MSREQLWFRFMRQKLSKEVRTNKQNHSERAQKVKDKNRSKSYSLFEKNRSKPVPEDPTAT